MKLRPFDQEMMDELRAPQVRPTSNAKHNALWDRQPELVAGAVAFMIAAGLIHLAIAPLHWGHAPAHGLFFAASGLAEVVWGIAFWRKPSAALCRAGMVLAGEMITLWAITRAFPAPFGDEPGEIEITGLASKLLEGLGLAVLAALAVSGAAARGTRLSAWRMAGKIVIASLVAGWLTYLLGMAAVPVFPGLAEPAAPVAGAPAGDIANGNSVGEDSSDRLDDLQLVVAGVASPFANGGEVPVAGDVMAQLTFTPGDERYGRNLDLYLYHLDTSTSLDPATIQVTGRMRYMEHGTFRQIALPVGEGHYLLLLQFPMPGEWQLELEITATGVQNTIYLDLNLFD